MGREYLKLLAILLFIAAFNVVYAQTPNLTVSITYADTNAQTSKYEENMDFNVIVTVTSDFNATDNVLVKLFAEDSGLHYMELNNTILHIDANTSATLTFTLSLQSSPYTYRIYAIVDPLNSIAETNENDNTSNYLYADIVRYTSTCGTLTTGHYEINASMININTSPCWDVPAGETVVLSNPLGYQVYMSNQFLTLIQNAGSLTVDGTFGRGMIYNNGVMVLNITQIPGHYINISNYGDLTINSDLNIGFLNHFNGRITVNGTPVIVFYNYLPMSFLTNPSWQLVPNGNLYINNFATQGTNSKVYVDQPITDPTGTYVYFYTTPTFSGTNEVMYLIVTNGVDFSLAGKTMHSIQINAKAGDSTEANFTDVNVDTMLLIDNQPNTFTSGPKHVVRFVNSTLLPLSSSVGYTDLYLISTIYRAPYMTAPADTTIYMESSTYDVNNIYGSGPLTIDVNLEKNPSTVYIQTTEANIMFVCHGNQFLYILPSMRDNNKIDLSNCLLNIDYNRNFTIEVNSAPSSVYPDKDYNIVLTVTSTAELAPVTVVVAAYLDGVPSSTQTVTLNPNESKQVTFTFHSTPKAGTQHIEFVVDPDNVYPEANELDNSVTVSVTVKSPPTTAVVGGGGAGPVTAASTVYVGANLNEEAQAYVHIFWKYPFKTKAYIFYYGVNGELRGPETVILKPGDNIIKVYVKPYKYGEVGKVVVRTTTYKEEITIYARPLASLYPVTEMSERLAKAILFGIFIMLFLIFLTSRKS